MQVSVENTSNLERKLTISVPAERLESKVSERLRDLSRNVRLKGFRPGKVPARVIEQRFGAQVRKEVVGDLIRDSFGEAVRERNLRPAVAPAIETTGLPEDGEFRYVATFEVMPEIGAIDVSKLKVKRPTAEVADSDVDGMIETLRMQRRSWEPVERPAANGDMVMFESVAEVEGARLPAEGVERSGTIVGSTALPAEVEDGLVGLAAGQEKVIEMRFPDSHQVPAFAGQQGRLTVKVVRVSEGRLPEVDDAFMASFGITEGGLEKFRAEVRANLERELRAALMARLKGDVVSQLLQAHADLEFPARMVEAEARGMAEQAEHQARSQGQKTAGLSHEALIPAARQRVAAAVLLGELARQNDIRLDPNRLNEMLASIASTYEDPMQVVELYRSDAQLMQGLESRVIEDQLIDWIADHADLTVETLSFAEVMKPGTGG
jgi:trigger factor